MSDEYDDLDEYDDFDEYDDVPKTKWRIIGEPGYYKVEYLYEWTERGFFMGEQRWSKWLAAPHDSRFKTIEDAEQWVDDYTKRNSKKVVKAWRA